MVVLTATIPSRPSSAASSATASTSSSDRSGAILTSSGTGASPARRGRLVGRHAGGLQDRAQRLDRLQVAQARGVRGRHVHHQVVGVRREPARARRVVRRRLLGRGHLGLADVHPDHEPSARRGRAQAPQPGRDRRGALVVEAHPVAQRPLLQHAPQPRRLVARLRVRGDRADLDEAEAEHRQARDARPRSCRTRPPARTATGTVAPRPARRPRRRPGRPGGPRRAGAGPAPPPGSAGTRPRARAPDPCGGTRGRTAVGTRSSP